MANAHNTDQPVPNGIPEVIPKGFPPPIRYTYRTYRLEPSSPSLPFLAGKYAALSLHALTTDPASFGMAYSTEASFTPADWVKRLSRPNVHLFICVAHSEKGFDEQSMSIEKGEWIGMVTQIGPTPKEEYWFRDAGMDEPLPDDRETKWHQTATWIDPAHRGKGVAKLLIEAGVAYARESIHGDVSQARIRAITGPANETSKSLYGGRGFPDVGRCTIPEAVKANGNEEWGFHGRKDWNKEMMESRLGVVMERIVKA